jgi:ribosomal-protein-alanine N-acetyltransferase
MEPLIEKSEGTSPATEIDWSSIPYPPAWLLQTQRLIIRPYHINDVTRLAHIANHPEVAEHMTDRFPHPYTVQSAQSFINHISPKPNDKRNMTAPPIQHFSICLRELDDGTNVENEGGLPIGGIGVDAQSDIYRRGAEMGYWMGRDYWGKGYMSEAVHEFAEWLFELEDGLTGVEGEQLLRIAAMVNGGNPKSTKVLERVGFKVEGRLSDAIWKAGEVSDLVVLGLTRRQWNTKAAVRTVQG